MTELRVFTIVLGLVALLLGCVAIGDALGHTGIATGIGLLVASIIIILLGLFSPPWKD